MRGKWSGSVVAVMVNVPVQERTGLTFHDAHHILCPAGNGADSPGIGELGERQVVRPARARASR